MMPEERIKPSIDGGAAVNRAADLRNRRIAMARRVGGHSPAIVQNYLKGQGYPAHKTRIF